MGEVVILDLITSLDIPAERVLSRAIDADITQAIVIGRDKDGDLYFASSVADGAEILWLIERAKLKLHDVCKD